ncbi:helix-turn-helix domain-containing protein [Mycobacteroides abscessus]|nr:helix-turn-helix domain-containing protein [Mycobacteroides abscessus]SHR17526.1 transcriptional regulator, y4mF family [Mycobacteroides abscessus subsp. bolletii]SHS69932.1 transcriptional regulator, y4mF family [Mycobacteroides abscessus subsp. bolletii]SHS90667.1 transcriptional regulator, y4mF family [Mycobacteroides abscessus subsp. bolletii]SKG47525.1 transcriptional regulator, y4mF family [Mycobacteroides abscessus subsp. bolletii]
MLGVVIQNARKERQLTREDLAYRSKISVSTLQKIEVGPVVEPGFFTIGSLLEPLGLTLADLERLCEKQRRSRP